MFPTFGLLKTVVEEITPRICLRLVFFVVGVNCQLLRIGVKYSQERRGFRKSHRVHDEKGDVSFEVDRYLSLQLYVSFLVVVLS